ASRLAQQGGAGLIVDYGYEGPALGDTFQAVKAHAFADPFAEPGERDLTAHVDFATLSAAAERSGALVAGPMGQGQFLTRLGLIERAEALAIARPAQADKIAAARDRLAGLDQMGRLFRVLAVRNEAWPQGEGFA
ncbi:MAG: hypothetical protein RIS52_2002, partial [Pseudomonadota bacterium]